MITVYGAMLLHTLCLLILLSTISGDAKQKILQIITQSKPEICSEIAEEGDEVYVHYTGLLETGAVFDSSRQANRGPLPFVLGQGQVIAGWEEGIKGMCVGEKRKLVIPPHLAYGSQGHPPTIPPSATLTFETELISVNKKPTEDIFLRVFRFLILPVAVVCAVFFIYNKLKKDPHMKKRNDGRNANRARGPKKSN